MSYPGMYQDESDNEIVGEVERGLWDLKVAGSFLSMVRQE